MMRKIEVDSEIELRPLQKQDAEIIFRAIDSNRSYLREWLPFVDATREVQDSLNYISSVVDSTCHKKDEVFEVWKGEEFAGLLGLKEIDHYNKKTEVGYWLVENMQGSGIMIKSCRSLLNYAFDELKMNRIQIKCAIGNDKSMQIPNRLQFYFEGIERQGEKLYEKYVDLKTFSMLRKDWLNLNKE